MKQIWEHWPQKYWSENEWEKWHKAGRPRVPLELRLSADEQPPLDTLPMTQPTHTLTPGFSLHDDEGRRRREEARRRREVNRLLQKFGLR